MALALRQLGFSVHDAEEYNLDNWLDLYEGRVGEEVLLEIYRDVDVVVDLPACTAWHLLLKQFPNSKVILMERDSAESWVKSLRGMYDHYFKFDRPRLLSWYPYISKTHDKIERYMKRNLALGTGWTERKWYDYCSNPGKLSYASLDNGSALWKEQYIK